jgi:twitching motility protein PilI
MSSVDIVEMQLPTQALGSFEPPKVDFEKTEEAFSSLRYGFNIGAISLLIPQFIGSEMHLQPPVYRIPNTPEYFEGVCNIRGNIVPVYNFFKAFNILSKKAPAQAEHESSVGERRKKAQQQRILSIGEGERMVAVVVDQLPKAIQISEQAIQVNDLSTLPDLLIDYVSTSYLVDEVYWHELDLIQLIKTLSGNG